MVYMDDSNYDKLGGVFLEYLEYKVKNNKDKDDTYGLYIDIKSGLHYSKIYRKYKWTIIKLKKEIDCYMEKGDFIWD